MTLHPVSFSTYLADLAKLDKLSNQDLHGDQGLALFLRGLIQNVTVVP